jgi:UDP-N-acetylmuramoylalanine--D-glutamate ligase
MIPEMSEASEHGIPVISEVELASRFLNGRILGITGSNGKSTVTSLLHAILAGAGMRAFLAGNIGVPLISFAERSRGEDIFVTELSSFQLEHTREFHPHIAVLLNLTPDHLDWHGSFENYAAAKRKILARQTAEEFAVLNRDDDLVWGWRDSGPFQVFGFSRLRETAPGCYMRGGDLILADGGREILMPAAEIPLPGEHNRENVLAAAAAARILGLAAEQIRAGILSFHALAHRLEEVRTLDGVRFFNDSKATNVDAALTAIRSFDEGLILILGGRDKGGDFGMLRQAVRERARCVLLIGEAAGLIEKALEGTVPLIRVGSMHEAAAESLHRARKGDVVLLSPACTSFDMFENFEHRGEVFKREVAALTRGNGKRHG